jgi:hypothetical protein
MKISPVGAELLHADRRTDIKLIFAFRSYANAPEINMPTLQNKGRECAAIGRPRERAVSASATNFSLFQMRSFGLYNFVGPQVAIHGRNMLP